MAELEIGGCVIYRPSDYIEHYIGSEQSSCFYFRHFSLGGLVDELKRAQQELTGRFALILVTDTMDKLHAHAGATNVYIPFGSGQFYTLEGFVPVRAGDCVHVPPNTPHLSVADKGTVMPEIVFYLGAPDDRQASREVPQRMLGLG